eukprot:11399047-Alexandrium_andersonii.AAC.1
MATVDLVPVEPQTQEEAATELRNPPSTAPSAEPTEAPAEAAADTSPPVPKKRGRPRLDSKGS